VQPQGEMPELPPEVMRLLAPRWVRRRKSGASKHARELDPVRFEGFMQASHTAPRPWDQKAKNRKKNKAARAARRNG
jgi:hypothetical protein